MTRANARYALSESINPSVKLHLYRQNVITDNDYYHKLNVKDGGRTGP